MATARDEDEATEPGPPSDKDENFVKTLVVQQSGGEFGFDFGAFERSEAEATVRGPRSRLEETVPLSATAISISTNRTSRSRSSGSRRSGRSCRGTGCLPGTRSSRPARWAT